MEFVIAVGAADSQHVALNDGDATSETLDVVMVNECLHYRDHRRHALVVGPHHDDPGMRARWVGAHVAEAAIQGDQQSPLADGSAQHRGIVPAAERFLDHSIDVVAASSKDVGHRARDVLVELDLQRSPVSGRSSSRASSAP